MRAAVLKICEPGLHNTCEQLMKLYTIQSVKFIATVIGEK